MLPSEFITDETARSVAASFLGQEASSIPTVSIQLSVLARQGLLIDLTVAGTSMFTKMASWSELGIPDDDDVWTGRLNRPTKNLIPEERIKEIRSCETSMRALLDDCARDVAGFRPYRWLPYTRYDDFTTRWQALLGRWNSIKADILANLDLYRDQLVRDFTDVAEKAWRSVRAQDRYPVVVDSIGRHAVLWEDEFIDEVVARVLAKFPTRQAIETGLVADYIPKVAIGAEDAARDAAAAQLVQARLSTERSLLDAQRETAWAQARAADAEARKVRDLADLEVENRRREMNRIQALEAAHMREQLASIASPFEELFIALRQQMAEAATDMAISLKSQGRIHPKVAERGRRLVQVFDLMATHDDKELRARLVELNQLLSRSSEAAPSVAEASSAMEEIIGLVATARDDFLAGPSRFSLLD